MDIEKSANTVEHERKCMHCHTVFTVNATMEELIACEKCGAGIYPSKYFDIRRDEYARRTDMSDADADFLAMRDVIDAYCGCHNSGLCYEHNEYAMFGAACYTETLQVACLDLNSFLMEKRYEEISERLDALEGRHM